MPIESHLQQMALNNVWQLNDSQATLHSQYLSGSYLPFDSTKGLFDIRVGVSSFPGNVLGLAFDERDQGGNEGRALVRGNDIITNYAQHDEQTFACRLNLRLLQQSEEAIYLELIIYLQTNLLESFPQLTLCSQVTGDDAYCLQYDREALAIEPRALSDAEQRGVEQGGVLVRPAEFSWSYFETTHPEEVSHWDCIASASENQCKIQRRLEGSFLEKGVIRILRVRGAFLNRANDIELARKCLESFAMEEPPLTT